METITKSQIEKIDSECMNDWKFNQKAYKYYGIRQLIKNIRIDKENKLEFMIGFNERNQVYISINRFYQPVGEHFPKGQSGTSRIIDRKEEKRKNINRLIKCTEQLSNTELLIKCEELELIKQNELRKWRI